MPPTKPRDSIFGKAKCGPIGKKHRYEVGITTYVNGAPMNPVQLYTSTVSTDTIDYVATDQTGLTATSTRIVIIEAPSIVPTDNASTTEANSTSP